MTDRSRELLLEMLLIRARYSESELHAVEDELKNQAETSELRRVLSALGRIDVAGRRNRGRLQNARIEDLPRLKSQLTASLKNKGSKRRVEQLARRLGLPLGPREVVLEAIEKKLNSLSDFEALELLRRYRIRSEADEGYIALANQIMHGGKPLK
ncbi:MAG: hypothetical protein ACRED6_01200 [Stellaceae bacterium]